MLTIIAVRVDGDGLLSSKNRAHRQTGGRWLKQEHGRGQFALSNLTHSCGVQKTRLHNKIALVEESLILESDLKPYRQMSTTEASGEADEN